MEMRGRHHMKRITVNNEARAVPSGAVGRREKDAGKGCLDRRRAGWTQVPSSSWIKVGRQERQNILEGVALEMFWRGHGVPATQYTFQSPFFQL